MFFSVITWFLSLATISDCVELAFVDIT